MAIGDIKTFDIVYTGLTLQVIAVDLGNGTTFEIKCLSGYADLNALYWNDGIADGSNFSLGPSLNMNGSGEDWDGGIMLSSTGLGALGTNKPTYLTAGESYTVPAANVGWGTLDTLGVRATSTSAVTAEGNSIKGVDGDAVITLAPKACVDDAQPVIEGANASFTLHLDHVYAYDVTINYETVIGTAGTSDYTTTSGSVTIAAGDLSTTVSVATTDDQDVEQTETFTLHLTSATADIPGTDISVAILCADGTGTILDNDEEPSGPPGDATALSHGYWQTHGFGDSEGFASDVGSMTLDQYFTLDSPSAHTWLNPTTADLTFTQAINANGNDPNISPGVTGNEAELVREAATAVLNYNDADNSASFVAWYIYERNLNDNDAIAGNNPTDAASVLIDLKSQVDASLSGASGAYSVEVLADLLKATHE